MNVIELRQERSRLIGRMRELNEKSRNMSPEDEREWTRLQKEAQQLKARIDRAEFLEPEERALDQRVGPFVDPLRSAYSGSNPLLTRGGDQRFASPEAMEERSAFLNFLRTGERSGLSQTRAALGTLTPSGGGVTVPLSVSSMLIEQLASLSTIRRPNVAVPGAQLLTINGPTDVPVMSDAVALRLTESETDNGGITDTNPAFSAVELRPNLLAATCRVKWHLLSQSALNIEEAIISSFVRAIADLENQEFLTGTGTGEPQGITNGTQLEVEEANSFTATELTNLYFALPPQYLSTSVFIVSPAAANLITTFSVDGGQLLFGPDRSLGLTTLFGRPMVIDGLLPSLETPAKVPVVFASLSQGYIIAEQPQFYLIRDDVTLATSGEVRFTIARFSDGRIKRMDAIRCLLLDES